MKQVIKKHKTQLLAVLLAVAMITCFIPQTAGQAYAENGNPVVGLPGVLGTGANTDSAQTVYYGADIDENNNRIPVAWRVISYDGTGNKYTKPAGAMTLFASDALGFCIQFNWDTNKNNDYEGSNLKSMVDGLYGSLFTDQEKSAIQNRTLSVGEYSSISPYSAGVSGTPTSGYLWPLSTAEALALPSDTFRSVNNYWWLRSPGYDSYDAALVDSDGIVNNNGSNVGYTRRVRPAFNLDLSSVLFTSAAEGGKSSGAAGADALRPISANSTGEWKLTVHDSSRDAFKASAATGTVLSQTEGYDSWSVPIACEIKSDDPYTVIPINSDKDYVSVILADSSDNALYYGNVENENPAGIKNVTIPTGLAAGKYKLHVFYEEINGDKFTDYSSAFRTIDLTVTAPTHTVTVSSGNGSGEYAEGASVTITAAAPEEGKQFKEWTGDVGKVTFTEGSKTTSTAKFDMPAEDLSFEATYEAIPAPPHGTHSVTVSGGNGSGDYAEGESVTITAAAPEEGMQFREWTGDVGKVTFTEGSKTTSTAKFNMPAEDLSFKATYEAIPAPPEQVKTAIPTGKTLTYNGKSQTGVAAGTGYSLSGMTSATNAGTYQATATLDVGCVWDDETSEPKTISWKIEKATVNVAAPAGKTFTYNGKARTGVAAGTNYTLTGTVKATKAGKYTAKAALKSDANYTFKWTDGTTTAKTIKWTINKAANTLTIKAKTATVKGSTKGRKGELKKTKTLTVGKVIKFTNQGQGAKTYVKKSGNAKITIAKKTGKVTVKKGLKKGTYKVKVEVKAAGNANYKASAWKVLTFKIKVK